MPAHPVTIPCPAYHEMRKKWDLVDDLLGGTLRMRQAGTKWLPQEPAEKDEAYTIRLERTTLYNAYRDTLDRLCSKPFGKAVSVTDTGQQQLDKIKLNVDKTSKTLTPFAREVFYTGLNKGLAHILVDYPTMPKGATLADERRLGIPSFVNIDPARLVGWSYSYDELGNPTLDHIRIKEVLSLEDQLFNQSTKTRYRVFRKNTWEVYEEKDGQVNKIGEGVNTLGVVPLVTIYFNRSGLMTADPPLEDLAWVNLSHWQSFADQRNMLRFARRALLLASGLDDDDMDKAIQIGPNQVFRTKSKDAKMTVVETSGAGLTAGRVDLQDLEEKMEILGMQPSIRKSGSATATGRAIDEGRAISDLESWVEATEGGLTDCYALAAKWVNFELPKDFKVDIFNDFNVLGTASREKLDFLLKSVMAGKISHLRFMKEVRRLGGIDEAADVEVEVTEAKTESEETFGNATE